MNCCLCLLNGDVRPAKLPWDGFPCCGRCQTEAKVKARWFKAEMFKPPSDPNELVLWRYAAHMALGLGQAPGAIALPPPDVA